MDPPPPPCVYVSQPDEGIPSIQEAAEKMNEYIMASWEKRERRISMAVKVDSTMSTSYRPEAGSRVEFEFKSSMEFEGLELLKGKVER